MGLEEMTEHKFTDEELQKCIECCIKAETWGDCEDMGCPAGTKHGCRFYLRTDGDYENTIYIEILKDVLALINRQKAQIEQLQKNYQAVANKHYANGIADLADRLESNIESGLLYEGTLLFHIISKTVKEMTEEKT